MMKIARILAVLGVIGFGLFWVLTIPRTADESVQQWLDKDGDLARGEAIFWAGGCASCHAVKGAKGEDKLRLGGNHALNTPVGTFHVPNISPHKEHGIGEWTVTQFANAMLYGTRPDGGHYFPAFPYTSYALMNYGDVKHLWSYLMTLEPVDQENKPHELSFPFNISRGVGLWKLAFMETDWVAQVGKDTVLERGRYLVESLGHCGECHTPRTVGGYGGVDRTRWLAGGPAPEGEGRIPNITPHPNGMGEWTEEDIVYYLESGFTPDYDSVGGSMVSVQQNMARLPKQDLEAIAAYLKRVAPVARQP